MPTSSVSLYLTYNFLSWCSRRCDKGKVEFCTCSLSLHPRILLDSLTSIPIFLICDAGANSSSI
jgi:hypothetical protein